MWTEFPLRLIGFLFFVLDLRFFWIQVLLDVGNVVGRFRFDSPGRRSCGVLVPCAGRGIRGKVPVLFSYYAPVSGPAFDAERRSSLNEPSTLLSSLIARAVLILGGDSE